MGSVQLRKSYSLEGALFHLCLSEIKLLQNTYIYHGLYLYFSGLFLRRTSQQLSYFIKRNHVTIWNWIQKYHPQRISSKSRRISEFIIDETLIKVGSEYIWLWVAIEPSFTVIRIFRIRH